MNPEVTVGLLICACLVLMFFALVWLGRQLHALDQRLVSEAKAEIEVHAQFRNAVLAELKRRRGGRPRTARPVDSNTELPGFAESPQKHERH